MVDVAQSVLFVLSLFLIVGTALPLLQLPYWWIRLFDFPRVQIVLVALAVLFLFVGIGVATQDFGMWDGVVAALLAASIVYQIFRIFPYTDWAPTQVREAQGANTEEGHFRLVVSNVLMSNRDAERWRQVVLAEEPDVIAAVETDSWWTEQIGQLEGDYPYSVELPQDDTYGMVIRSRMPFVSTEVRNLVEEEVPSAWLQIEMPDGPPVALTVVHPRPPRPDIRQDSDFRDAELILVAQALENQEGPIVVAGDLNDVAWSRSTRLFQRISGLLDPRRGRGFFSTFHADHALLRYPLDHVFHSDDLTLVELRLLGHVGSDHFPMLIELAYSPVEEHEQKAPPADSKDREEAEDMVDKAAEHKAEETPEEREKRKEKDV